MFLYNEPTVNPQQTKLNDSRTFEKSVEFAYVTQVCNSLYLFNVLDTSFHIH